jgi:di/tricarboxylate transporter
LSELGKMLKALTISLWLIMHPVHVTMTSIDYISGTDSLKVSFKMYFDDFLRDYQTIDDDRDLKTLFDEQPLPSDLINKYFNTKVFIYVNNKLLIGKLLTVNLTGNEIGINLIYKSDKKPKKITVRNMILTGWYSDQTNLTIIKIDNFEKGIKLTSEHNEETTIIK